MFQISAVVDFHWLRNWIIVELPNNFYSGFCFGLIVPTTFQNLSHDFFIFHYVYFCLITVHFASAGVKKLHFIFTKIQKLMSCQVINQISQRQIIVPGTLLELKLRETKKIMQYLSSGLRTRFSISTNIIIFLPIDLLGL